MTGAAMTYDALVRGGRVVVPELDAPVDVDVAIADGRVAALLDRGHDARAEREWDVAGKLVLPGAIDPHVHVHWPYLDSRTADDYETATRAAVAGGTTTIIDFAIEGRADPLAAVRRRRAQAQGASVADFSFHCVVSDAAPELLDALADVVAEGITSFKLYMTYRRRGLAVDDATLEAIARRAAQLGAVIGVHAEDADIDDEGTQRMRATGMGAARNLPDAKPPIAEARAIRRAGQIAAAAGAQLWILHLSSAEGLAAALETRARVGQPAAIETCPQYLLLDRRSLERRDGHRYLCSPPLREPGDPPQLLDGVADGRIDWVGTDHCLFLAAQKDRYADAFWDCPHGLPGVQTRPALMLAALQASGMPPSAIATALSTAAARWFGLYPRKGTLLPGSDADLAVWDPDARTTVATDALAMGGDWTPYEGMEAAAPPALVLVRGMPAVSPEGDELPRGHGAFLARPLPTPDTPEAS
jgi:dihydropyrimidinase